MSTNIRKPLVGTRIGKVASDKRDQTIKVVFTYKRKVPKYGKYVRQRTVYHVHDPNNEAFEGDTVEIAPCRPISKTKSWRLVRIVERAPGRADAAQATAADASAGEGAD
ncbi:MAG: 30S ribosomal protein S17 [Phycisphaera sp.]|nr:30S ribosomal protein S17 [Phycisphaera sp.]